MVKIHSIFPVNPAPVLLYIGLARILALPRPSRDPFGPFLVLIHHVFHLGHLILPHQNSFKLQPKIEAMRPVIFKIHFVKLKSMSFSIFLRAEP